MKKLPLLSLLCLTCLAHPALSYSCSDFTVSWRPPLQLLQVLQH